MMKRSIFIFTVMATLINLAMATNYTVGAPGGGWDQATDLQTWASSIKFLAGDTLIFSYTLNHDVVEVPQADYASCQITNPIQTYSGGNTVISLSAPVKRYFVCGTAGHCASGMKVAIDVLVGNAPPPASTPITLTPSSSPVSSPSPKASSPAPASSPDNSPPSPPSPASNTPASNTPASSPTTTPPTSSAVPPPPSSSASGNGLKTSLTMGFGLVVMTVLIF